MARIYLPLCFLALLACGGDDVKCPYLDRTYLAGERFTDGCNACTCNQDGSVTCAPAEGCADCTVEGKGYAVGETWPKGDGCNFCQCTAEDTVECSAASCGSG